MGTLRIGLFGLFGQKNIGNECTLRAMVQNLTRCLPDAFLYTVCSDPADAAVRHGLAAVPIRNRLSPRILKTINFFRKFPFFRLIKIMLIALPFEFLDCFRVLQELEETDLLIMTGTGLLTDSGSSAWGLPYSIFKWSLLASLVSCKVRFVSVGVGPLRSKLSRFFIGSALHFSDFCSYRDNYSKARLQSLGINVNGHFVYPDLVFSLTQLIPRAAPQNADGHVTIGVGVMDYYGQDLGPKPMNHVYESYLCKMCDFVIHLLDNGYAVRILYGDITYDQHVREDLMRKLAASGYNPYRDRIYNDDIHNVFDLINQLNTVSYVVAPRYHNLVLALMLNKPVISLSYDPKNDALLEGFALEKWAQSIATFEVLNLTEQLHELERHYPDAFNDVSSRLDEYSLLLGEQYMRLVKEFLLHSRAAECSSEMNPGLLTAVSK
jgi:polysaccharide pyruvyl transferase WcaK-like protein